MVAGPLQGRSITSDSVAGVSRGAAGAGTIESEAAGARAPSGVGHALSEVAARRARAPPPSQRETARAIVSHLPTLEYGTMPAMKTAPRALWRAAGIIASACGVSLGVFGIFTMLHAGLGFGVDIGSGVGELSAGIGMAVTALLLIGRLSPWLHRHATVLRALALVR